MPNGPGPRQRRATKISNRSHVTPFDKLAQWNAQIMNLGAQGSIPSIVGNTLQFVKLNASSIPGIMDNPATEDLDMNSFGIIRANRLEVDTNALGTPYVSIIGGQSAKLFVKATNTALIEMEGPVNTTIRGNSQLKIETGNSGSSNDIRIEPYGNLSLQALGAGGTGNGTIVMGNSSLALMDLNGTQISLDAGTNGLQMGSDGGVTIDATANIEIETFTNIKMDANGDIEIDAGGRLDLSGNQIFIDSDGAGGVNISAANVITMDAANVDIEATTKLDLSGNNITINSTNNNIEVKAGATLDLSSTNSKLNGTTTVDITGTNINIGTSSSIVDISGQISLNKVANLTATNVTADNVFVDDLHSNPQNTKITLNDNLDVNQKDISNCNTLRVDSIFQNNAGAGTTPDQLIIGNFINGSSKYVKFGNKIALYTTNSVTTANTELEGSNPNNYLIGYKDTDICGGLIYRADIGSGAMNKLITTTSLHRFSTNFFRTLTLPLDGTDGTYSRSSPAFLYTSGNPGSKVYKAIFYNTDQLILNPGVKNWWPGSAAYRSAQDPPENAPGVGAPAALYDPGTILPMKFLQLSKNQFIRVLNFTFEGYNNSYQINFPQMGIGNKLYFEILFGFGNTRAYETGPYTAANAINFQKCYQVNTEELTLTNGASNAIILKDLSLNTVHYSASPTYPKIYQQIPIENKAIPTSAKTSSTEYYSLAPMIFIRCMNPATSQPHTFTTLDNGANPKLTTYSWQIINNTNVPAGVVQKQPASDMPWTCPFGAQFMFEHYIPAVDSSLN